MRSPTTRQHSPHQLPGGRHASLARARTASRTVVAGLAVSALTLVGAVTLTTAAALPATAQPAPNQSPFCPADDGMPDLMTGTPLFTDRNLNTYVGGNLLAANSEMEGLTVVAGDARVETSWNVGSAGAGSQIVPQTGDPLFVVGGDLTIAAGAKVLAGQAAGMAGGLVTIGGQVIGDVTAIDNAHVGGTTHGVGAVSALAPYAHIPAEITALSTAYAALPATGTAVRSGGVLTMTSTSPAANPQVFHLAAADLAGATEVHVNGIKDSSSGAPVVINVNGTTVAKTGPNVYYDGVWATWPVSGFGNAAARLLWNFPTATQITIGSAGSQWVGSFLVADPTSTLSIPLGQTNGRIFTNGNFSTSPQGNEQHAYPWIGHPLLACAATTAIPPVTTTGGFSITKTVTGTARDLVPATTGFTVSYTVDGVAADPLSITAGGAPVTVTGLPADAEVVFTETTPSAITGLTWAVPVITAAGSPVTAATPLVITAGSTAAVTVTNTAVKNADGGTGGGKEGGTGGETGGGTGGTGGTGGSGGTGGTGGGTSGTGSGTTTPTLPVTGSGATTGTGATTSTGAANTLPVTGSSTTPVVALAMLLVLAGAGLLVVRRRPSGGTRG